VLRICFVFALFLISFFPFTAQAVTAGYVDQISGKSWIERSGERAVLYRGDIVSVGDVVTTSQSGRVKLLMLDKSKVYMGRQSRISVEHYQIRDGDLLAGSFNMLWGKVRFLVSKSKNAPTSFLVKTKAVMIDVQSAQFAVLVDKPSTPNQTTETKIMLFEGSVVTKSFTGQTTNVEAGKLAMFTSSGQARVREISKQDVRQVNFKPLESKRNSQSELAESVKGRGAPIDSVEVIPPNTAGLTVEPSFIDKVANNVEETVGEAVVDFHANDSVPVTMSGGVRGEEVDINNPPVPQDVAPEGGIIQAPSLPEPQEIVPESGMQQIAETPSGSGATSTSGMIHLEQSPADSSATLDHKVFAEQAKPSSSTVSGGETGKTVQSSAGSSAATGGTTFTLQSASSAAVADKPDSAIQSPIISVVTPVIVPTPIAPWANPGGRVPVVVPKIIIPRPNIPNFTPGGRGAGGGGVTPPSGIGGTPGGR
jgi:hypothetical protein